jgi:hypothetical protein
VLAGRSRDLFDLPADGARERAIPDRAPAQCRSSDEDDDRYRHGATFNANERTPGDRMMTIL